MKHRALDFSGSIPSEILTYRRYDTGFRDAKAALWLVTI